MIVKMEKEDRYENKSELAEHGNIPEGKTGKTAFTTT